MSHAEVPRVRALLMGYGSIGRRHARNLRALGVTQMAVYDVDPSRRHAAEVEVGAAAVPTLAAGLDAEPDIALICTPPAAHLDDALAAAQVGCHLFVEKPLTDRLDARLETLLATVEERRLVTLVACNLRFHHGPATVKRLLDGGELGRPLGASLEMGQYLPDWHPAEDYRRGYSASRALGGGIVLDAIHELDYACWLFGEVREVVAFGGRQSSLEIETEDFASLLLRFASGVIASLHVDYIQRAYSRWCRVFSEEATAIWDIATGVRLYRAREAAWRDYPLPPAYDVNDAYVEELRHFLRCVRGEERSLQTLADGAAAVRIALAARASMATGERVRL